MSGIGAAMSGVARKEHRPCRMRADASIEPACSEPPQSSCKRHLRRKATGLPHTPLLRYARPEQIGRRPALDDPIANLRQPARVGNVLERGGQPSRCGCVELPLRLPAQQRPFFGAALRNPLLTALRNPLLTALRNPLLTALRNPLLTALRDPLLATFFDPLVGPLLNLFRQHRAHLLQPWQRPGLPTAETPRQQHVRHPRPERLRQLLVTLLPQQIDQRPQQLRQPLRITAPLQSDQRRHQIAARQVGIPNAVLVQQKVPLRRLIPRQRCIARGDQFGYVRRPRSIAGGRCR